MDDKDLLSDHLVHFKTKMQVIGEDRKIAHTLSHFIASATEDDLNREFIYLKTSKDFSMIDPMLESLLSSNKHETPTYSLKKSLVTAS